MSNIFEQASRAKLRFTSSNRGGEYTVEDLWSLPLISRSENTVTLDSIAIAINKEIRATAEQESFVTKKVTTNARLELGLEIVKRVIEVRLAEQEVAAKAQETAQRKARLKELLLAQRDNADQNLTAEQIEAELAALEA